MFLDIEGRDVRCRNDDPMRHSVDRCSNHAYYPRESLPSMEGLVVVKKDHEAGTEASLDVKDALGKDNTGKEGICPIRDCAECVRACDPPLTAKSSMGDVG